MANSDTLEKNKKNSNLIEYIIIFLIFFVLGMAIGVFATKKYLNNKDEEEPKTATLAKSSAEDITNNSEYKSTIDNLYSLLGKSTAFYSTKGLNVNTLSNEQKLSIVYNYIIVNKLDSTSTLNTGWYGSEQCPFNGGTTNFNVDVSLDANGNLVKGTNCTVSDIASSIIQEKYQLIFGNNDIDTNVNFNPKDNKTCILVEGVYTCGNVDNSMNSTGDLEVNYEITKVLKENDKIEIYDKGYLTDNRSSIKNPDDGFDKYYLHSSDSTDYYHELKSADNIVFKHTFKKASNGSYYYSSSEVSK